MSKGKLQKFNEMKDFPNVVQPAFENFYSDINLKGNWKNWFKNTNPIVLELGCGKGEYTVGLAKKNPDKNFIGIDIKGSRMWKGAKSALVNNLPNVGFLRIRIEQLTHCFLKDEVHEIWITFPDPQKKLKRSKRRLTHPDFINKYQNILKDNGLIHLKTDSKLLHSYTLGVVSGMQLQLVNSTNDLYKSSLQDVCLGIKTFYEKMFLLQSKPITYCSFRIN